MEATSSWYFLHLIKVLLHSSIAFVVCFGRSPKSQFLTAAKFISVEFASLLQQEHAFASGRREHFFTKLFNIFMLLLHESINVKLTFGIFDGPHKALVFSSHFARTKDRFLIFCAPLFSQNVSDF